MSYATYGDNSISFANNAQITTNGNIIMIASPEFTGTPLAPTASSSTNSDQIATTSFVKTTISNLVDSAPGTLDTLNELAAALDDDPNFAKTVTNSIATKAPLANPTFTGVPTAPTAASGTKTTQVATTEFVANGLSGKQDTIANGDLTIAKTSGLQSALELKAPLASPTFTGTPLAPTASFGTNTTQVATTAFVVTGLSGKQDTIADGDLTIARTSGLQNELDLKAPLASPTFTGTPLAPTASSGTNTTQIATTEFVANGLSGKQDTISEGTITNDQLAGSIANDKLEHNSITIAGTPVALGNEVTTNALLAGLGISISAGTPESETDGLTSNGQAGLIKFDTNHLYISVPHSDSTGFTGFIWKKVALTDFSS